MHFEQALCPWLAADVGAAALCWEQAFAKVTAGTGSLR